MWHREVIFQQDCLHWSMFSVQLITFHKSQEWVELTHGKPQWCVGPGKGWHRCFFKFWSIKPHRWESRQLYLPNPCNPGIGWPSINACLMNEWMKWRTGVRQIVCGQINLNLLELCTFNLIETEGAKTVHYPVFSERSRYWNHRCSPESGTW